MLGPGIDGQGRRVADAGGEDAVGTGLAVDFPDHRAVFFDIHAAFADIAVRSDADIELAAIGTGGHRLGPVVIDLRRQFGQFATRGRDTGRTFGIGEGDQIALIGDVERAVDESEAVWRIEAVDEGCLEIGPPVAVAIAQQGNPVAAFDRAFAALLDQACDDILGPQLGRLAARSFRHQQIAIGQEQHLARDLEILGDRADGIASGRRRQFVAPAFGRGNFHRRNQRIVLRGQSGPGAGLVEIGIAAVLAGGDRERQRKRENGNSAHAPIQGPVHWRFSTE